MGNWILHRLREPTTWAGIITMLSGILGWKLSEEVRAHVITIGMSLAGLLLAFGRDGKPTAEDPPLLSPPKAGGTPADHATGDHDRGLQGTADPGLRSDAGRAHDHRSVKDRWMHRRDPDR